MNDTITKAPAPMIGGIIWPPVDAEASTPAANLGRKPLAVISGMVMMPVEAVLATAEPEMVPVSADEMTATKAAPPRKRPAMILESSITKPEAPETTRNAPKIMNSVMLADEIVVMIPNMPSSL